MLCWVLTITKDGHSGQTGSSLQLTIKKIFPVDLSGILCILIFAHCLLCLFLVITEKSLTQPFLLPSMSISLLYGGVQTWTNHWRCFSPVLSKGEEPPPSTCCQNSSYNNSGYCWSSFLQGHITGSYSTWCPREPQGLFLQSFSASQFPTQLMHGVTHLHMQDFAFTFVELHEVPVYFTSLLKFFWVGTHPSGLSSSANLPRVYFVTSLRWLLKF